MLSNTLTIGGDTYNRLGNDLTKGVFGKTGEAAGNTNTLQVQQGTATVGKTPVFRRLVRRDLSKTDEAGLKHEAAVYLVIQHGDDALISEADVVAMASALCAALTASTNALLVQIVNGEV